MKITTSSGVLNLNDDATPSTDDMNDIISSVTRTDDNGAEFQRLCDASTGFPENLTNEQFLAACNEWLAQFRTRPAPRGWAQINAGTDAGAAHTPGPWFTCEQVKRPHNHALVGIGNGATHVGYSSVTPAMTLGEAEANARLIAAAPELLAAAIEMQALIENLMKAVPWGKTFDLDIAALNTAPIHLAAAIAKAKGGAQ